MKQGDTITLDIDGKHITATVTAVQPIIRTPKGLAPLTQAEIETTAARLKGATPNPDPHFTLPGSRLLVKVGYEIRVLPSAKGRHDGYIAIVRKAHCDRDGRVREVEVTCAPHHRQDPGKVLKGSMQGTRTYRPERLQPKRQSKPGEAAA